MTIVKVNGANASAVDKSSIESYLNEVYGRIGISFEVTVEEFQSEEAKEFLEDGLDVCDAGGFMTATTDEMRQLKRLYMDSKGGSVDEKRLYLFLVNKAQCTEEDSKIDPSAVCGDMPRNSKVGYLFAENAGDQASFNRTVAHELGHGAFTYEHPFDNAAYTVEQGTTHNLMDYVKGDDLAYFQWQSTFGLNLTWRFLEDDEDAMKLVTAAKEMRVTSVKKDEYFIVADDDAREKDATTLADIKPKKKLPVGAELQAQEDKDGGGVAKFKFVAIVADAANNPNGYVADGNNSTVVYTSMGNLLKVHSCSKKMKLTKNLTTSDIYKLPYSNVNVASDLDVSSYTKDSYVDVDYKCEDYFRIKEDDASEGSDHIGKWVKKDLLTEDTYYIVNSDDVKTKDINNSCNATTETIAKGSLCLFVKENNCRTNNKKNINVKVDGADKCIENTYLTQIVSFDIPEDFTLQTNLTSADLYEWPFNDNLATIPEGAEYILPEPDYKGDKKQLQDGQTCSIIAKCGAYLLLSGTKNDDYKGVWIHRNKFKIEVSLQMLKDMFNTSKNKIVNATPGIVNAINKYSKEYGITTIENMSHFLGQCMHESKLGGSAEGQVYSRKILIRTFNDKVSLGWMLKRPKKKTVAANIRSQYKDGAGVSLGNNETLYNPDEVETFDFIDECVTSGSKKVTHLKASDGNAFMTDYVNKTTGCTDGNKIKEDYAKTRKIYTRTTKDATGVEHTDQVIVFANRENQGDWYGDTENLQYDQGLLIVNGEKLKKDNTLNIIYACKIGNGNYASGDGIRYKGRGLIQCTGKANYEKLEDALKDHTYNGKNIKFVDNGTKAHDDEAKEFRDLLAGNDDFKVLSTMIWWKEKTDNKDDSEFKEALKKVDDNTIKQVTSGVNGGQNGISERIKFTHNAYDYFTK